MPMLRLLFLSTALLCCAHVAAAQPIDTLKRIADTGTINLGHRESSVPFSYYDNRRQVVGYSHELMLKALDTIKAELNLPALTLKLVPVTPQNRLALVQNGAVDIECGSTTHNRERARQVAFSVSIFRIGTRLMTARDSGIHDFPDLAGKRVVVTAATTSERLLRLFNEGIGRKFSIVVAKDHGESFALLEAGRVDAFMMDDALLYGERAKAHEPERWVVVGSPMSSEVYGCMMRSGDRELKRIVDAALTQLMQSGEAMRIYTKWFERPIPPRGLNLNWPASPDLVELYRAPNDRPID
ncbi:transporter substrate-binding domain-containing protein [Pseudorhodoferax sp.]|uniref:transporter substrate-binding domain-containing protein n=1 Tax=Pseudorhodoferax sp. TaxID=1993553 RepID=UPI003FA69EEF